jgi:hypothetical protein
MPDNKKPAVKAPMVARADIGGVKVTTGFEITPDEHLKLVDLCADAGLIHLGIRLAKKEQAVVSAARRKFLGK